jgi:heme oxygenase (mycobilin-producing)
MAIRVIIEREIQPGNDLKINDLLIQLRAKAAHLKGYIAGETLRDVNNVNRLVVISTWNSLEDWNNWHASRERKVLQDELDEVLKAPGKYRVYTY